MLSMICFLASFLRGTDGDIDADVDVHRAHGGGGGVDDVRHSTVLDGVSGGDDSSVDWLPTMYTSYGAS